MLNLFLVLHFKKTQYITLFSKNRINIFRNIWNNIFAKILANNFRYIKIIFIFHFLLIYKTEFSIQNGEPPNQRNSKLKLREYILENKYFCTPNKIIRTPKKTFFTKLDRFYPK